VPRSDVDDPHSGRVRVFAAKGDEVARIKAVLVGVDVYERPEIPNLNGCVNDVGLVRHVLKEYFGVPNEDIRVVVDHRATKANILHRVRTTCQTAEPGDVVVIYFSGHGSQIRDRDGDELTDFLDELICPHDMDWDRQTYIVDDDLDALFEEIPEGVLLEVFFDCCFFGAEAASGELAAWVDPADLGPGVRYLPPPLDIASRAAGDEDRLDVHTFAHCQCFAGRNVLWAASAEGEPAVEDDLDGRTHGVFTYWGCRFIEANAERIWSGGYSRGELVDDLRSFLNSLGYAQHAQLAAPGALLGLEPFTFAEWTSRVGGAKRRP
jgi:metacaspase-1